MTGERSLLTLLRQQVKSAVLPRELCSVITSSERTDTLTIAGPMLVVLQDGVLSPLSTREVLSNNQRQIAVGETAKLNNVDPQAWLADVLARIADTPQTQISVAGQSRLSRLGKDFPLTH